MSVLFQKRLQNFYSNDFNFDDLEAQLGLVHSLLAGTSVSTMKEFAIWLVATPSRVYLCQVEKLVKLVLTVPATNACSERSFSALKRIKTYLRSSMSQRRV